MTANCELLACPTRILPKSCDAGDNDVDMRLYSPTIQM
jgi:hypothetical protein